MQKLTKEQQVQRLQTILKHDATTECPCCEKVFIPMFELDGYGICPDCDGEVLERHKNEL